MQNEIKATNKNVPNNLRLELREKVLLGKEKGFAKETNAAVEAMDKLGGERKSVCARVRKRGVKTVTPCLLFGKALFRESKDG